MSEQSIDLTPEKLVTSDGVAELNRVLNQLLRDIPSDGNDRKVFQGYGTPESQITAGVGSIFMRLDGGASTTLYVKESGSADTGWRAI